MNREIRHTWFFPNPPERVWECLTEPELLAQWLMENNFKAVSGHTFQFRTTPMPAFGFDGIIHCTVKEVVPHSRLSYTWQSGPGDGTVKLDTLVTWTLKPEQGGTEVILEHTGFKDPDNFFAWDALNKGWGSKLGTKLADIIQAHEQAGTIS